MVVVVVVVLELVVVDDEDEEDDEPPGSSWARATPPVSEREREERAEGDASLRTAPVPTVSRHGWEQ